MSDELDIYSRIDTCLGCGYVLRAVRRTLKVDLPHGAVHCTGHKVVTEWKLDAQAAVEGLDDSFTVLDGVDDVCTLECGCARGWRWAFYASGNTSAEVLTGLRRAWQSDALGQRHIVLFDFTLAGSRGGFNNRLDVRSVCGGQPRVTGLLIKVLE